MENRDKSRWILTFLFLITVSLHAQIKFPDDQVEVGFKKSNVHARIAMPLDGKNRVWVKGSADKPYVSLINTDDGVKMKSHKVGPPFYTDIIETTLGELKIAFCNSNNECEISETLFPAAFNKNVSKDFSILLYGCMEPFQVSYNEGSPVSEIFKGENNSSKRMRELFSKIAHGTTFRYNDSVKIEDEFIYNGTKDSALLKGKPKLIITTGDQVYVDAGYGVKMRGKDVHPLSAWETKRRPHPFNPSKEYYKDYLNKLYNATYSFKDIEHAHKILPVLSTIDDHELRDGWGSQGDEYKKGVMNPMLSDFYKLGKQAYIEHQLKLSNFPEDRISDLLDKNSDMDYSFNVNGVNGYIFDLRSSRNRKNNTVLGEDQWKRFETWLKNLKINQEIILVTSIPLTLRPVKSFEKVISLIKPEIRDDVRDGWSNDNNLEDRDRLLSVLTKYRIEKDIKPIFVSGDVHKSALIEIWIDPFVDGNSKHDTMETMILGYEIVASGISHEFIKTGISKSLFRLTESQRIGDGFLDFTYNDNRASWYPMVRNSTVAENFGALEFSGNKHTRIHTYVYNKENDALLQYYLELDFDKKLPDDDYYIIREKPNGKIERTFTPPIPHGKRVIFDD